MIITCFQGDHHKLNVYIAVLAHVVDASPCMSGVYQANSSRKDEKIQIFLFLWLVLLKLKTYKNTRQTHLDFDEKIFSLLSKFCSPIWLAYVAKVDMLFFN